MAVNKRTPSVSYSRSESQTVQEDRPSDALDEEHVQLALDPKLQTYLAQVAQASGCWGRCFPTPFERATSSSWWDPTFDSEILEDQYRKSSNPYSRFKFRYAVFFSLLVSTSWFVFFLVNGLRSGADHWPVLCITLGVNILCLSAVLCATHSRSYADHILPVSLCTALLLCTVSVALVVLVPVDQTPRASAALITPLGHFSMLMESLLIIYTLIPLKLYMSLTIGVCYSVTFEVLTGVMQVGEFSGHALAIRLLLHVCIHLIGLHILIMANVRMRNTFMKVGQSLLVRRQLESEKKLKENMIHSLMPPSVALWLLNDDEHFARNGMEQRSSSDTTATAGDIRSLFRPFNMNRMENVSILFADIVGFTKMSSNKSAEELVEILNNLFQRFDLLCKLHSCEKISTLGDCYYCVSGCPEPQPDHAKCCVEMGLSMIQAIGMFVQEQREDVNMRVGVHTGTVLCGIVGTKRFKFDVWSNDVTLANRMESTGRPGTVHVSEKTVAFLNDLYLLEDGDTVFGLKTFFILGRKGDRTPSYSGSFRAEGRQRYANSLQLFVSPPPAAAPASPHGRPRVLSCDTAAVGGLAKPPGHDPRLLSPDTCRIKASSLPSVLDQQEAEQGGERDGGGGEGGRATGEPVKTPTSTASSGKYTVKVRGWKMPKFLRKGDQKGLDVTKSDTEGENSNCEESLTTGSGYQQVPIVIESAHANGKKKESWISVTDVDEDKHSMIFLDEQRDSIDVKSYISQSRSDIGAYDYSPGELGSFIRAGSYRSQYGRPGGVGGGVAGDFPYLQRTGSSRSRRGRSPIFDIVPTERARSATVASANIERPKRSLEVPNRLSTIAMLEENLQTAPSVNSRKDSGIKSNSRRSSIQQIDNPHLSSDMMQHRVSGYYTSSQSSIGSPQQHNQQQQQQQPRHLSSSGKIPAPFFDKFGACIQNLRKQSDRQLIKCVQDNLRSRGSYFIKPPLSQLTLFFRDDEMERQYRANVHSVNEPPGSILTLANSRFNTYLDVFVSTVVFVIVSTALFLLRGPDDRLLVASFAALLAVQCCGCCLCFRRAVRVCERRLSSCVSRFYRWNMCGGVLVSLPLLLVVVNFSGDAALPPDNTPDYLYTYVLFVGVIHFCNFTQLNCWMKNILATCLSVVFLVLFLTGCCPPSALKAVSNDTVAGRIGLSNESTQQRAPILYIFDGSFNETTFVNSSSAVPDHNVTFYKAEIIMDLIVLLVLVWLLNREFEISYRISFHANYVANRDKIRIQQLKNQADYLIYNIVPEHVADQLKKNAKYSENFKNVGIIFASIVNFNEMYDESYLGGKEFLRVLNELIGDFDELLDRSEFQSVEKIKTIGSTFMAASGLNSQLRRQQEDPNEHLFALMDFALEMQNVIDNFNRDLLEFNLILRVGYSYGEVTAAVIGNTKLYYDIWGDAVNLASRMDSTGINGRIQIGEHNLEVLQQRYIFEARGSIYVKGKDNMNVYLLQRKKNDFELNA